MLVEAVDDVGEGVQVQVRSFALDTDQARDAVDEASKLGVTAEEPFGAAVEVAAGRVLPCGVGPGGRHGGRPFESLAAGGGAGEGRAGRADGLRVQRGVT